MDEALMKQLRLQAQAGDQSAIYELYTETRGFAYYAALRYLGGEKDIQPILKDTYIIAFGRLREIPPGKNFVQWLNYVLAVKCINHLRGQMVGFLPREPFAGIIDDREPFPAAWLEQAQVRSDVLELIRALPEAQKQAIQLHHMGGLSLSETAQCMNITEIVASGHMQMGVAALRAEMHGEELAADAEPVLTTLFRMDAAGAEMPAAVAKEVYQEMMLFFMGGGKAPKLVIAIASTSSSKGSKGKGWLPWVISLTAVTLLLVFLFWNFQRTQRKVGETLVSEHLQNKALIEAEADAQELQYQAEAQQHEPPPPPQGSADSAAETDEGDQAGEQVAPNESLPPVESPVEGEIMQIID